MKEHLINPPAENSYQYLARAYMANIDLNRDMAENGIDKLAWMADKQVRALRDKIKWLEDINKKSSLW